MKFPEILDEPPAVLIVIVDAFPVKTLSPAEAVIDPTVRARFPAEVSKAVCPAASVIVKTAPRRNPRVAIVNVWSAPEVDENVALLNSSSARFAPAKVIVPPVAESNVTVPVPASHVASVDAFVHVPETVHVSEPKSMADAAEEILTLPVTDVTPLVL